MKYCTLITITFILSSIPSSEESSRELYYKNTNGDNKRERLCNSDNYVYANLLKSDKTYPSYTKSGSSMYHRSDTQYYTISFGSANVQLVKLFMLNMKAVTIRGPWIGRPTCTIEVGVVVYRECLFSDQIEQIYFDYIDSSNATVTLGGSYDSSYNFLLAIRSDACCQTTFDIDIMVCDSSDLSVDIRAPALPSDIVSIDGSLYLSPNPPHQCIQSNSIILTTFQAPPFVFLGDDSFCTMARALFTARQIHVDRETVSSHRPHVRPESTKVTTTTRPSIVYTTPVTYDTDDAWD